MKIMQKDKEVMFELYNNLKLGLSQMNDLRYEMERKENDRLRSILANKIMIEE